jgi:hypothetical protein
MDPGIIMILSNALKKLKGTKRSSVYFRIFLSLYNFNDGTDSKTKILTPSTGC